MTSYLIVPHVFALDEIVKCDDKFLLADKCVNNQADTINKLGTTDLKKLEISFVAFNFLSYQVSENFSNLETFSAQNCSIKSLPTGSFKNLKKLTNLTLNYNFISDIETAVFEDLELLQILNLHSNQIEFLNSETFSCLKRLEKLSLSKNRIRFLDDKLFVNNANLTNIELQENLLVYINYKMFVGKKDLRLIDLTQNLCKSEKFEFQTTPEESALRANLENCSFEGLHSKIATLKKVAALNSSKSNENLAKILFDLLFWPLE
jgi:leucine-rich repeats and immunoglobulin-like domains protein 1/3